jgi:hypothetical protein
VLLETLYYIHVVLQLECQVCHSWFLINCIYYKCCANVSAISLLLLSVEQSEESQSWLGDLYEQHDSATCDFH